MTRIHDAMQASDREDAVDNCDAFEPMSSLLQEMGGDGCGASVRVEVAVIHAPLAYAQPIVLAVNELGVNAEGEGIVLNLVDQVHGLRGALAETLSREPQNSLT